jgi:hypothetical protein
MNTLVKPFKISYSFKRKIVRLKIDINVWVFPDLVVL